MSKCPAAAQSTSHQQHTNAELFYMPDDLSVTQPTVSESNEGRKYHMGIFHPCVNH